MSNGNAMSHGDAHQRGRHGSIKVRNINKKERRLQPSLFFSEQTLSYSLLSLVLFFSSFFSGLLSEDAGFVTDDDDLLPDGDLWSVA